MTDEPDDQLRARLRDVPAPDPAARERAIAAAMDVFEAQQAPRRRSARWLMPVAAAVIGVAVLGGALALLDPAADNDEALDQAAATQAAEVRRAEHGAGADRDATSVVDAGTASTSVAAEEAVEEATEAGDVAAEAPADAMVVTAAPSLGASASDVPVLRDDDDVAAAVDRDDDTESTPMTACGRTIVTEARDERDPTAPRPVLLAVEETPTGSFVVLLVPEGVPDACTELERLPLP